MSGPHSGTVNVVGLGYVGCVSVACLAQAGHRVIGVDVDASKVALIQSGIPTIVEPSLDELMMEAHSRGTLSATSDLEWAVTQSDVSVVTVGTPSRLNGDLDLTHIYSVAEKIGHGLQKSQRYHAIAIRSTIKPGTCATVIEIVERSSGKRHGSDFSVVANPEFLREGSAINDYLNPPYVLLGADDARGAEAVASIYAGVNAKTMCVGITTAEIIKYVNNSWHALKVTFANEVGSICKALSIDSQEVMDIFVRDQVLNISPNYLRPGFAFGGSCLPKDLAALAALARSTGTDAPILQSIAVSNDYHIQRAIDLIKKQSQKRVGFLGLSFKAGTDDVRNSPALKIAAALLRDGYDIRIFDEAVHFSLSSGRSTASLRASLGHVAELLVATPEELLAHAEFVVVAKKDQSFEQILLGLNGRPLIDLVCMANMVRSQDSYVGLAW
ncbi:nucleotide sugar dehydrogenase [Candidatus Methylomirabilis sp.]|uniref:nucleotide sugar dehydrogenase n=1 Tax=Candidatus Methylomirabilis sp. TaxID=2032687 RepID=UPI002A6266A9|nr:nucleotide sugar dehydrogenase [Candidatus Methylomirabilis sp.]